MFHSKLRQVLATIVAALALLALVAPAAEARKPVEQPPPADLIVQPIWPIKPIEDCICLPLPDVA
jgi:hypothetical protein